MYFVFSLLMHWHPHANGPDRGMVKRESVSKYTNVFRVKLLRFLILGLSKAHVKFCKLRSCCGLVLNHIKDLQRLQTMFLSLTVFCSIFM